MESPLIGKTYKLPPRTVACIEVIAEESAMTKGGVLEDEYKSHKVDVGE